MRDDVPATQLGAVPHSGDPPASAGTGAGWESGVPEPQHCGPERPIGEPFAATARLLGQHRYQ